MSWRDRAACHVAIVRGEADPSWWFPPESHAYLYRRAKPICDSCPVRMECLEECFAVTVPGLLSQEELARIESLAHAVVKHGDHAGLTVGLASDVLALLAHIRAQDARVFAFYEAKVHLHDGYSEDELNWRAGKLVDAENALYEIARAAQSSENPRADIPKEAQ